MASCEYKGAKYLNFPEKKIDRVFPRTELGYFETISLPYCENTVHKLSKGGLFSKPKRVYVRFTPKSITKKELKRNAHPVVFLFHGTDETAFDQEKAEELSWLELSDREKVLLVFPQSQGIKFSKREKTRWGWQPGDIFYLDTVFDQVLNHSNVKVDKSKVFCIGFSNGGLFLSEIILRFPIFSASVNYMGGIVNEQARGKYDEFVEGKECNKKNRLWIITGQREENRHSCGMAKEMFEKFEFDVKFTCMENAKHEYLAESTQQIWEFFINKQL